jgi:hypothetical protein
MSSNSLKADATIQVLALETAHKSIATGSSRQMTALAKKAFSFQKRQVFMMLFTSVFHQHLLYCIMSFSFGKLIASFL